MNTRLRRAGIVGLSTVVATSMMTLGAASSFAAIGDYTAVSALAVAQAPGQAAGNVTLEFANSWTTGATQTFTVGANNCSTAAGIAAAVEFAALPTVTVTDPAPANAVGDTAPTFLPAIPLATSSSSEACRLAGVTDRVTLTQVLPSTGTATDNWLLTLSGIVYDVGATTPKGNINLATAGAFKTSGSVVNAIIPDASFTNTPARAAALPNATGVSLGTQSFNEATVGAFFPAGTTRTVVLTQSGGGTFTNGVTPTITVPTGYLATNPVTAGTLGTYTFTVTAPAIAIAATVTVSGLTSEVGASVSARTLTATGMAIAAPAVKVLNVVDYNARTGGATRYETAAALFTGRFPTGGPNNVAVLARGDLYPDALSANYLAGKLGTGTLLTPVGTLSSAARLAILNGGIDTVYITGGTGAVSQAVENQIEALHVGNVPAAPFIVTVRLGGADRYATNQIINENNITPENTVLLASGLNFPDALAFGPIASKPSNTLPLILTRGTTLGSHELAQLSDFNPTNVVIGGGTGVVSAAIATQLATNYTVLRLAGADRTGTAAAIANWATVGVAPGTGIRAAQGFASDTTYVATGNLFPDSLAAGPVAGANNNVLLLTYSGLGAGIPSYLAPKVVGAAGLGLGVSTLHALGLTGAVSAATMKAAAATISVP